MSPGNTLVEAEPEPAPKLEPEPELELEPEPDDCRRRLSAFAPRGRLGTTDLCHAWGEYKELVVTRKGFAGTHRSRSLAPPSP